MEKQALRSAVIARVLVALGPNGLLLLLLGSLLGCSRSLTPISEQTKPSPKVRWIFEPKERGAVISTPAVFEDRVYVGAIEDQGLTPRGALYCLRRSDGSIVWKFDAAGEMQHMYSSPCVADGRVYIGEGMHANLVCNLYCIDALTGQELWRRQTAGHIESTPCVAAGKVYFAAGDDGIWCLEAATGKLVWRFRGPYHFDANPLVINGLLYIGSGTSRNHKRTELLCLKADTGAIAWRKEMDLPIWAGPDLEGSELFVTLGNGRLIKGAEPPEQAAGALLCLDAQTQAVRWRLNVPDGILSKPVVQQNRVYVNCRDGQTRAVDRANGEVVWQRDVGSPIVTSPALAGNHVFIIGSDGQVMALAKETGAVIWQYDVAKKSGTRPQMFSSPVAASLGKQGLLYFGAELRGALNSAAAVYCLEY